MKSNGKGLICILILLVSVMTGLAAESVGWKWVQNDSQVKYYRYQVNGEDSSGWTVVGADTTSYRMENADPSKSYTFYLQQSYDGNTWSQTSSSTWEGKGVSSESDNSNVVIADQTAAAEAVVDEAIADETVVQEAVATDEAASENPSRFEFSVLFKSGVGNRVGFNPVSFENGVNYMRIDTGVAFDFANIVSFGDNFGLGVRSDISVNILPSPKVFGWSGINITNFFDSKKSFDYDTYADIKLVADLSFGPVQLYLGSGLGYSLFNQAETPEALETSTLKQITLFGSKYDTALFVSALAGTRYGFNDILSLGIELGYRYMMPANAHIVSADVVLGLTF